MDLPADAVAFFDIGNTLAAQRAGAERPGLALAVLEQQAPP